MTLRNHILELDGLRGIAILLVLAVHFTPKVALPVRALEWTKKAGEAGWIGVDLFFVLSGFLITGILLRTKGKAGALRFFFARRILRIFPLYLVALLIIFVVLPLAMRLNGVAADPEFDALVRAQGWVWMHCTNIGMYLNPTRTFQSGVLDVSHFWSLSVEEHFYLVWPFVVLGCSRRAVKILCLCIVCSAFAVRLAGIGLHQNLNFFVLTPCRLDALAIGSFLAIFAADRPLSVLYRSALVVGGICAASLAAVFFAGHGLWPSSRWVRGPGFTVIGLLFGSLLVIVLSGDETCLLRRSCRYSVLRFFGTYSYGIYVIHGLLVRQMEYVLPFPTIARLTGSVFPALVFVMAGKTLITVAVALVSWRVLESPALRLKRYFEVEPDAAPNTLERGGAALGTATAS